MTPTLENLKYEFLKGNNSFLSELYHEHQDYCISFLKNRHKIDEDLASGYFTEALLVTRKKIIEGQLTDVSNLRNYLLTICINLSKDNFAKTKRAGTKEEKVRLLLYNKNYNLQEEQESEQQFMVELCRKALYTLDDKCISILKLFYFESLSMQEICDHMGFASANVVKTLKYRCYKKWVETANEMRMDK